MIIELLSELVIWAEVYNIMFQGDLLHIGVPIMLNDSDRLSPVVRGKIPYYVICKATRVHAVKYLKIVL